MKELELNGHMVRVYDSIDELPIVRFHRYNRYLLVDAGIGSDISDFDTHLERVVRYLRTGNTDNAVKEMENMRQNVYMVLEGQNVRHLSFACLVASIDGEACDDLSPSGLEKVLALLGGATRKEYTEAYDSVKKKIDGELILYFPSLFDDVRIREYYDVMKRLTLKVIEGITDGATAERDREAEALRDSLVLFTAPKVFTGKDGVEVRHDKDFETLCIAITQQTGKEAKRMTVLEYYNAYEYVTNRNKAANKAR